MTERKPDDFEPLLRRIADALERLAPAMPPSAGLDSAEAFIWHAESGTLEAVAEVKKKTIDRSIAPQDMLNFTITVSNFGMLAGRYATPLMVPPTVAILGTGKLQHDVMAVMGGIEVHRRIPLSLTFDHRCVTGGEACRFLAAVIEDLEKPQ